MYETVEDVRVDWDGMSDLTAADLNAREVAHGNNTEEAQTALDHAREFLREVLTNGPVLVEEIYADAKKAGVSQATLRRAKTKEKIRARREDPSALKSPWIWEWLPAGVHI
jgi:transcriptional accessory protein Tex/SPT6